MPYATNYSYFKVVVQPSDTKLYKFIFWALDTIDMVQNPLKVLDGIGSDKQYALGFRFVKAAANTILWNLINQQSTINQRNTKTNTIHNHKPISNYRKSNLNYTKVNV